MAGRRVIHGSLAAAAAVLATAAATVDIPEKLHLKATPILFYAMPISMPLPPLASLGHVDSQPLPVSLPRVFSPKKCVSPSRDSSSTYASSPFSHAQGASASISASSRRTISHLLPVYLSTSVAAPQVAAFSQFYPAVTPPTLAPFSFSSSALYAAPVTKKHTTGYSAYTYCLSQGQESKYLESLLGSLSFVESSVVKASSQGLQSLHTWHIPTGRSQDSAKEAPTTVVLLGWLGAQQKHLKMYADWYNARGIPAVTFVIPLVDILSFKVEKNAKEHVDALARQLVQWLHEQGEQIGDRQLVFHTFSNTGWLTYGVVLEKMQEQGEDLVGRIKGCVIDSAPVPNPDPQVWASGFSAALLKKRSSLTKPALSLGEVKEGVAVEAAPRTAVALGEANGLENAILSILEKFFLVFLKLPVINQRLSEVVTILQKKQPPCPQLYIYSTADKVIPVEAVEAFIEEQRMTGRVVRSCNLQSSPHVDHFRSHPGLYSEQLSDFLKEVVLPSPHAQADAL